MGKPYRSQMGTIWVLFWIWPKWLISSQPGRVAQLVGHLTRKSGVLGSVPGLATYFRFSFRFSRMAVVSYWRKYVHEVLVNRLGGLSLPMKSVVRLTDRPIRDVPLTPYFHLTDGNLTKDTYNVLWRL